MRAGFDIGAYFEIAVGGMGMRAPDFWTMTPQEFYRAWEGWCLRHGVEKPMNKSTLADLIVRYGRQGNSIRSAAPKGERG